MKEKQMTDPAGIDVVKWVSWEEAEKLPAAMDLLGGFFDDGMRWEDYLREHNPDIRPYLEAIRRAIIHGRLKFNGAQHQNMPDGCPVFNDGKAATFSYRAWGDLMAGIWSTEEDKDYNYMDFYC